ncbi:MAG: zinc-dependent metalloprotease [Chloroflexota bacterium]|nr:zinc-dependent metalloprotease [Chloroflexota bacterium]
MAENRKGLERALLLGAALGAVYVATRPKGERRESGSKLVDWRQVEDSALRMVRRAPGGDIARRQELNRAYRQMVHDSTDVITRYTDIHLQGPLTNVYVFDRQDWIRANLEGFRRLFGRIEEIQNQLRPNPTLAAILLGEANRRVLSVQLGVLVGYLARRVLGQYDLSLMGKEAVTTGSLYFVEPNIARIERELNLPGNDLRMWIALHETTHAYEFEGNPWLREHFNSLLEGYFEGLNAQMQGMRGTRALRNIAERLRQGSDEQREGWVEIFMNTQQRQLFRKIQGIMSLLEGYSNHIMNTVGQTILPDFDQIKERIEKRHKRNSVADRLFARLTGLNIKLEQYRLGEIFVNEVVNRKGIQFMNRVWTGPEALPSMEEIRQPERWIRRIEEQYV